MLLVETFVDPARSRGTVYRAANWIEVGCNRGFARDGHGYSEQAPPKLVFLHPCAGPRGLGGGLSNSTPASDMECPR